MRSSPLACILSATDDQSPASNSRHDQSSAKNRFHRNYTTKKSNKVATKLGQSTYTKHTAPTQWVVCDCHVRTKSIKRTNHNQIGYVSKNHSEAIGPGSLLVLGASARARAQGVMGGGTPHISPQKSLILNATRISTVVMCKLLLNKNILRGERGLW